MANNEKLIMDLLLLDINAFHDATNELYLIAKNDDSKNNLLLPASVLSAFNCELYLKYIIKTTSEIIPPNKHDLKILYELLNPEYQNELCENTLKHTANVLKTTIDFNEELDNIANSFPNLRYFYEYHDKNQGHLNNIVFLNSFRHALLELLSKIDPRVQINE